MTSPKPLSQATLYTHLYQGAWNVQVYDVGDVEEKDAGEPCIAFLTLYVPGDPGSFRDGLRSPTVTWQALRLLPLK